MTDKKFEPLPAELPGLDIKAGLSTLGGNEKLYKKLLGLFVEDYTQATQIIEKAWDSDDLEEAERQAHTIKGLAGNIGAKELQVSAKQIEFAIKNKIFQEKRNLLNQFDQALKQTLGSLGQLNLSEKPEPEIDFSKVQIPSELLSSFKVSAKLGLADECREILNAISKLKPFGPQLVQILGQWVDVSKFEEVSKILDKIKEGKVSNSDPKILLESLENLKPHLKSKKPKDCIQPLEMTLNLTWPAELDDEVQNLKELFGKYKFKEAEILCDSLIEKLKG